jgi:hypothetical protein
MTGTQRVTNMQFGNFTYVQPDPNHAECAHKKVEDC